MASLTGQLVAETYKALLKVIDNDVLTASEKQITDGFGGGSNVFIDSNGFLRANKYKVTNGLATQFLKADGSLDSNTYLTGITSSQIIAALGYTPVTNARTLTINGTTYDLSANRSWTIEGSAAVWGNISGTLSNQTDLQTALNAKFNNPTGTISQYIRGDGSLATFPTITGLLPTGGTAGQILAKIDATNYNAEWIDNYATQTKNEVKLGATLAKGTPVYVSSANGTNMIVSASSNTTEATSSKTFGLLEIGGVTNDLVKCVTFGLIAGLDTSAATAGDPVWLGPSGTLLYGIANKPVAPAHMVYIGVVTRVQSNNGEIFVNVQNGFELDELHDVLITNKQNNQGLFYESSTGLWKNKTIATVLGYTPQVQLSGTGFVKASGTTISYDNSTYLTTADAASTYQPLDADLTAIAALAGTSGFLKKTASDIWVLDTNSYLTTSVAASTYQRLDKMVSNLLASDTEYPNSNAVLAKLALKADAENPVFTGNMTISGAEPKLYFVDTDQNPDFTVFVDAGYFKIYDQTAGATRFQINSDGNISTGVGKSITSGSFIKDGGTASQFLKADGSIDSSTYVSSAVLADYLLSATAATTYQTLANLSTDLTASATKYPSVNAVVAGLDLKQPLDGDLTAIAALTGTSGFLKKTAANTWSLDTSTYLTTADASTTYLAITTAASTYQRLDKMVSNLLASDTEYPNSNAVLAKLALKADAANPVFTGDMTISGAAPKLYFVDTDQNPDYTLFADAGYFYIYDQTAGATRFSINSSGNINTGVGKSITAGSFVKESGTSSQYLMADGSVTTGPSLSGYLPLIAGSSNKLTGDLYISSNEPQIWLEKTGTDAGSWRILGSTGGSLKRFRIYDQQAELDRFDIFSSGNVSIGTTTDGGYKFDVNGSGRYSGKLNVQFGTLSEFGFSAIGTSDFAFGSTNGRRTAIISKEGGDGTGLQFGYNLIDNTGIIAASTNGLGSGLDFYTYDGSWSTRMRLTNTGLLGINTVSPSYRLQVESGGVASYFKGGTGGYAAMSFSGDGGTLIGSFTTWAGNIYLGRANGTIGTQFGSQPDICISSNGNVLINTTSNSGYKFDVNGSARFITNITIDGAGSSIKNGNELRFYRADNAIYTKMFDAGSLAANGFTLDNMNAEGFHFKNNGTTIMRMPSSNNVAINSTTDGGFRFYVNGASSTWATKIDNTNGTDNVSTFLSHSIGLGIAIDSTLNDTNYLFKVMGGTGSGGGKGTIPIIYSRADGRTGFGTSTPNAVKVEILQSVSGNPTLGTASGNLMLSQNGLWGMFFGLNGSTGNGWIQQMRADSSTAYNIMLQPVGGNVMIGTTTDTGYKLDINGTVRTTGDISTTSTLKMSGNSSYNWMIQNYNDSNWGFGMFNSGSQYYPTVYFSGDGTNDRGFRVRNVNGGTNSFLVNSLGNGTFLGSVTATSFFESSDMRLKNLMIDNPIIHGIEHLQAKLYEKEGKIELGYFAQDAEVFMPYAVSKGTDGFLSLSYREVHTAKIARLEKRVAELEKQLNLN